MCSSCTLPCPSWKIKVYKTFVQTLYACQSLRHYPVEFENRINLFHITQSQNISRLSVPYGFLLRTCRIVYLFEWITVIKAIQVHATLITSYVITVVIATALNCESTTLLLHRNPFPVHFKCATAAYRNFHTFKNYIILIQENKLKVINFYEWITKRCFDSMNPELYTESVDLTMPV